MTPENCIVSFLNPAEYLLIKLKRFTHLLGNLVKKQGQSQSNNPNSSVGDPAAASQLFSQAEAESRLLLPAHAPL